MTFFGLRFGGSIFLLVSNDGLYRAGDDDSSRIRSSGLSDSSAPRWLAVNEMRYLQIRA